MANIPKSTDNAIKHLEFDSANANFWDHVSSPKVLKEETPSAKPVYM
jgi:hypothetical protein